MPEESTFHSNSVFFIEVDKIHPNPYQPRKEFDEERLRDLAESIRMYGLLQPLTVSRKEIVKADGGLTTEYELIAGERRLRASKLIGLREIPALIRAKEDDARTKLELAIIENLQREDLNSIDRARAFEQLSSEFGFKHSEIAKKVGKSREYVSNTIRLLALPEEMQQALVEKKISEGHTRPLLMLADRPEEQMTLFREILLKKMTVRDAEKISRKIATDKVRKHDRVFNQDIVDLEQEVGNALGTRVHIQPKEKGGKIEIDYFTEEDLRAILVKISKGSGFEEELPSDVIVDGIDDIIAATPLVASPAVEETPSTETVGLADGEMSPSPVSEISVSSTSEMSAPVVSDEEISTPEQPMTIPSLNNQDMQAPEAPKRDDDEVSLKDFTI